MKIALVHDWFIANAGSEKVVKHILECYPSADVFALFDFFTEEDRNSILQNKKVTTSFLQKMPFAKNQYQKYLQFYPSAIESLDISAYDLVLSSSHSVAKGVLSNSDQLHISYCHTPMRYAWDMYFDYINGPQLKNFFKKSYAKKVLKKLRTWDFVSSNRPDEYIANSHYISRRIAKNYRRESHVIYPPINTDLFQLAENKEDFYVTASRLVEYKKIDIIIEAFNKTEKKLYVIGDGSQLKYLKKIANSNIIFLGKVSDEDLKMYLQKAKAFVFAALEDFGILPVEAQASGTPVIALNKGGTKETVIDGKTGVLYDEQNATSLLNAIVKFENTTFNPKEIRKHAEKFSIHNFKMNYMNFVNAKWKEFNEKI